MIGQFPSLRRRAATVAVLAGTATPGGGMLAATSAQAFVPSAAVGPRSGVATTVVPAPPAASRPAVSVCPLCPRLFRRLLARFIFRGREVATQAARRQAQRAVYRWSRRQVAFWLCGQYLARFGDDVDRWRDATQYDEDAAWWWRYCSYNGY
jgi:hypothetical protein